VTRSAAASLLLLLTSALTDLMAQPSSTQSAAPRAVVAEYEGIIHPIAAEFFDEVIARADTSGATVTVFVLRTPGGLLDSTRTMVSRMIASRTPIVIFVGPSGSRAASAGFIIALAADVAVMAPGTHIGAAHPVSAGGGGDDSREGETMAKKAAEDAAAYARTLAAARGRNESLAAEAVINSRAFTEREALGATPPLIDFVASSVEDLLAQLDGRSIRRFNGDSVTLETTGITIDRSEMTSRQQFLSAIAHPQIAALLLTLGMLGLTIELWTPGAILPGVAGGVCLLLAFFAFQILPVNTTGLLLIAFGIGLLILELKMPSFGALGIGGTIALLVGAVMITSEVPGIRVGYEFLVPTVLGVAGIFLFLGRLAMRSQRLRSVTGAEGLVGERGHAMTALGPGTYGQVSVHGEIWRATSSEPITAGQHVRITSLEGLTLLVAPVVASPHEGEQTC
jgi:membrane-bound serine protease (ClpP class)